MAKAIKKYENGLSIRYLVKDKKYYITYGVEHVQIGNNFCPGYASFEEAENILTELKPTSSMIRWDI